MEQPEFVYSLDGEHFEEWDAVKDYVDSEYEPGERVTVYKGRPVELSHYDHVRPIIHRFVESIQEHAYDEDGDYAEDYLTDLPDTEELNDELAEIVTEWLNKHAKRPGYHRVDDIVEEIVLSEDYEE